MVLVVVSLSDLQSDGPWCKATCRLVSSLLCCFLRQKTLLRLYCLSSPYCLKGTTSNIQCTAGRGGGG